MVRVLLVCTGNVCRSPMAEGLLRKLLRGENRHAEIAVESAGTFVQEGAPASTNSVEVASGAGVDLRGHVAREVSRRLIERADLILTMEPEHQDRIAEISPEAEERTFLVTRFANPEGDPEGIPDPIGQGIETYLETFRRIEKSLKAALPRIVSLLPEGTEPTTKRTT